MPLSTIPKIGDLLNQTLSNKPNDLKPVQNLVSPVNGMKGPPVPLQSPPNSRFTGDIVQPHKKFLSGVLSDYAASIPLKNFWIVTFNIPSIITEQNLKDVSEFFEQNDKAKNELSRENLVGGNNLGIVFCRGFNFGGEKTDPTPYEVNERGFRSAPVAAARSSAFLNNLKLNFYESTVSFIDHILRPWLVLNSYYSSIARQNPPTGVLSLKQDITAYLYTRTGVARQYTDRRVANTSQGAGVELNAIPSANYAPKLRKTITFENCFPIELGALDYVQVKDSEIETCDVTFGYSNYRITAGQVVPSDPNPDAPLTVITTPTPNLPTSQALFNAGAAARAIARTNTPPTRLFDAGPAAGAIAGAGRIAPKVPDIGVAAEIAGAAAGSLQSNKGGVIQKLNSLAQRVRDKIINSN